MTIIDTTPATATMSPADAWHPDRAMARFAADAAQLEALRAELAQVRGQLVSAQYDQITDGSDPRLSEFWERAGEAADEANFCDEYDRLAEAMNGTPRVRDWDVEIEVTATVVMTVTASGRDDDEAYERAVEDLQDDEIAEAIRLNPVTWQSRDLGSTRA